MSLLPAIDPAALAADSPLAVLGAAVVLGASGSLHCLLMCGPLACAATPMIPLRVNAATPPKTKRANSALWAYHSARITAYAITGGLLGLFGSAFTRGFSLPLRAVLPWILVAALVASAFDLGKRLAPLPLFANVLRKTTGLAASLSPAVRAAVFGLVTPLLPCGLLYGLFAVAFTTASFGGGASLLGAFALGGTPALLAAQLAVRLPTVAAIRERLGPVPILLLQKAVPLLAAALIAWRAVQAARGQDCH